MYGMGFSVAPTRVIYDEKLFCTQLSELLFLLNVTSRAIFVGHSMGAGISATFAATFPERVSALVLLAPVGLPILMPFYARYYIPIFSEILANFIFPIVVPDRHVTGFEGDLTSSQELISRMRNNRLYQIAHNPGYMNSIMSVIREYPLDNLSEYYKKIGTLPFPVKCLWGLKDETTPAENIPLLRRYIPQVELASYADIGHCLPLQFPKITVDAVNAYKNGVPLLYDEEFL